MWPAHRVEISTRFSETTTTANKNAFINLIQQIQSKMLRYLWTSLFFFFFCFARFLLVAHLFVSIFIIFLYTGNCQANGMTHIWWAVQWEKIVK